MNAPQRPIPLDPKRFADARARAALRGTQLLRSDPADGPVRIFALRPDGAIRPVRTVDDLEGLIR